MVIKNKKRIIILVSIIILTLYLCAFISFLTFAIYIGTSPFKETIPSESSYSEKSNISDTIDEDLYRKNYLDPDSDRESFDYIEEFSNNFTILIDLQEENADSVYLKYFIMANTQAENERLAAIFSRSLSQTVNITIIDDQERYEELMGFNFQEELGVAGLSKDGEIILLLDGEKDDFSLQQLYMVLSHELVHIYHFEAIKGSLYLVPNWFNEGCANFFASYPTNQLWLNYKVSNDFPDLTSIDEAFTSGDPTYTIQGYARSTQFIDHLIGNWGMDNIIKILLPSDPYSNFYTDFYEIYGDSPENIYQTWLDDQSITQ